MAKRLSSLEKLRTLHQRHSFREIGRILGVNESVVRRAIKGQTKKPKKINAPEISGQISRAYDSDRKESAREYKRQGIPKLGVDTPPPAKRIIYSGDTEPSDTVEMEWEDLDDALPEAVRDPITAKIFTMLKKLRDRQNLKGEIARVRFFGVASTDASTSSALPGEFFWSDWEEINDYSDEEIDEYLESLVPRFTAITKMRFDV